MKKEAVEKAQNQSLTKGLLTTALSFIANPQNQNYGQGITPYLGKALQAGVTAAQTPFDKLTTIAGQNQKIEEYNDKKAAKLKAQTQEDDFETWKKGIYQPNSSVEKTFMAPGQLDSRIQSTDQSGNTEQVYPDFNNSTKELKKIIRSVANSNKNEVYALAKLKIIDLAIKGDENPIKTFVRKHKKNMYFKEVVINIKKILRLKKQNHIKIVKKFGKACSYPGTFMGSIHAMITSSNYKSAVIKTIKAGGCNCSRANFVGAYFAALKGNKNIPIEWVKKTKSARNITSRI